MLRLAFTLRFAALTLSILLIIAFAIAIVVYGAHIGLVVGFLAAFALAALGYYDLTQEQHAILRNYPIAAHLRFLSRRSARRSGSISSRATRTARRSAATAAPSSISAPRSQLDKRPFGTAARRLRARLRMDEPLDRAARRSPRSRSASSVGGPDCAKQPYSASVFNISAMSFGSLSANAIRALNRGAKMGGFAHDTGEGGFSPYHREKGGDIIWEIGSRLFRLPQRRTARFSPEQIRRSRGQRRRSR